MKITGAVVSSDMGVDEGLMIIYNEIIRTLALLRAKGVI